MRQEGTSPSLTQTSHFTEHDIEALYSQSQGAASEVDAAAACCQTPLSDWNIFLSYGQSLSLGAGGWPVISTTPRAGNYMYGRRISTHSRKNFRDIYIPDIGIDPSKLKEDQFHTQVSLTPLTAILQNQRQDIISDPTGGLKGFPRSALWVGESVMQGLLNFGRELWERRVHGVEPYDAYWIAANAGQGTRTVAQLSKGAEPEYYGRLASLGRQLKAKAQAEGKTLAMPVFVFMQGENDSIYPPPPYETLPSPIGKAEYKQRLGELLKDIQQDLVEGVLQQGTPPVILMYQTGGGYQRNTCSVSMAQFELARDTPNIVMFGPVYPYPNFNHLYGNTYLWLGLMAAKVLNHVWAGRGWRPLSPLQAQRRGREVLVNFHVPVPPLTIRPAYMGDGKDTQDVDTPAAALRPKIPVIFDDLGFAYRENCSNSDSPAGLGTTVPIECVEIIRDTVVRIVLAREPHGPREHERLSYADKSSKSRYSVRGVASGNRVKTHNGAGNLCDSDTFSAPYRYFYDPEQSRRGEYIPELIDQPYDLRNWCVAFLMEVQVG